MKLCRYLPSLLLAGGLLGAPAAHVAAQADESAARTDPNESFEVAMTYCYLGTVVDDSTGEIVEVYVPCPDSMQDIA
ncbi:MAG TPA: hypothetical protein VFU31_19415 [Candidatus Binatia bacterium]|nr:hypothetical protein [Candidatus Binatia bacterium]